MSRVDLKPADLGESGWNAIVPPRAAAPALTEDIECDYCIVGAGIAGLGAVHRLKQLVPDANVVLLDARAVADGPAGRNSGYMIDLPHALTSGNYAGDPAEDRRQIRLNRSAIAFAAGIAQAHGFSRETFDPCGKVNAAASDDGIRLNQDYARHLEQLGEAFEFIDAAAMRDMCGSDYYRGGLFTPGTAVVQPALYVRSLADAWVNGSSRRLFEHSPIHQLTRRGEEWRVSSVSGSVTAPRVILAVNGLIETFGFYRRRLMHINLYGSMTRALSDSEVERIGGAGRWGVTPAVPIGSSLRRIDGIGGHRIVIRNCCTYEPSLALPAERLHQIAPQHDRSFAARFPDLRGVEMQYRWSGRLCLSRNGAWALGELSPGLFSACCQNGLGLSRGTLAGIISAELASERTEDSLVPDYRAGPAPWRLYPEPFMTLGARGVIRFQVWRAGREV